MSAGYFLLLFYSLWYLYLYIKENREEKTRTPRKYSLRREEENDGDKDQFLNFV